MTKITKKMITELGNKVVELCQKNWYGDTSVYFNGKRVRLDSGKFDADHNYHVDVAGVDEDCHPGDYFSYYNSNHILSMSFEGELYDALNYGNGSKELEELFKQYGVYYELGNAWNLSVYPNDYKAVVDGYKY